MGALIQLRLGLMASAMAWLVASDTAAVTLYAEGESGSFGTIQQSTGPATIGPISLASGAIDAGGRHANFTGEVDAGIVRLSAFAMADLGAQSIGNWDARAYGSWEDTVTFDAPGVIPGLPGVEITLGTPGHAELVVDISGLLTTESSDNIARTGYNARLGYGLLAPFAERCCGPTWIDFRGQEEVGGSLIGSVPPEHAYTGTVLPHTLRLGIDFDYGEAFDVIFELSVNAEVGWEGLAPEELLAAAFLNQSALWQGAQNVTARVDDGLGGFVDVALPAGSWSFASDTFDYTDPVVVPEPSIVALLGLGFATLAIRALRIG